MKKALLIGLNFAKSDRAETDQLLEELADLAGNIDLEPASRMVVLLREINRATLIGSGKVSEIAELIKASQIGVIIFDHELSPSQQRNLEKEFKVPVIDRREVILDVFARRAQTKEATLQVELARVRYELPRLKRLWTHLERQAGGGKGYLKGMGEKQIEVDRRLAKERIHTLTQQLKEVHRHRQLTRAQRLRTEVPTFAVVGYTNAGKSTLFNAMTAAGVLAEDMLFATLDTTTRLVVLPTKEPVLLVDTVGFIRGIPHALVAAFRSTLEEALYTDILLHVIDASSPDAIEKVKAAQSVLDDLGAKDKQVLYVFNKCDKPEAKARMRHLKLICSPAVALSAETGEGIEELMETMQEMLHRLRKKMRLRIPQSEYGKAAELIQKGYVLGQIYEENDIILDVVLPKSVAARYKSYDDSAAVDGDEADEVAHDHIDRN